MSSFDTEHFILYNIPILYYTQLNWTQYNGNPELLRRMIFYSINKIQLKENGDKEVDLISVSQVCVEDPDADIFADLDHFFFYGSGSDLKLK